MIENLPLILTGLGLTASILYYTITLRNANKTQKMQLETRQTQLFMQIYLRYFEDDLFGDNYFKLINRDWEDPTDYIEKNGFGGPSPADGANLNKIMTFYEGVAVLINRKQIDIDLVYQLMPTNVTALWGKYGALIKEFKAMDGVPPKLYELVEELSDRIVGHAKNLGDPVVTRYGAEQVNN